MLKAVFGNVIHKIQKSTLFESDQILKPTINVIHTNFYEPGANDYRLLIDAVIGDVERNRKRFAAAGLYVLRELLEPVYSPGRNDNAGTVARKFTRKEIAETTRCSRHQGDLAADIEDRI